MVSSKEANTAEAAAGFGVGNGGDRLVAGQVVVFGFELAGEPAGEIAGRRANGLSCRGRRPDGRGWSRVRPIAKA